MNNKEIKNSIAINAGAEKVWDLLTNPVQTKKYMFGCEAVSEWKAGSTLIWEGIYEGEKMIFVKGVVLEIQPHKLLKYTVIDPNASYPDIPENYLNVKYVLEEKDGKTILTVTQDGFENAAEGEKRYDESYNNGEGWNPIMTQIKKIAESE